MKKSHKNKINHKYDRHQNRYKAPKASVLSAESIQTITDVALYTSTFITLTQAPDTLKRLTNSVRKNVLRKFLHNSRSACKVKEGIKICYATTKVVEIELKNGKSMFARSCTKNPAHIVDVNGVRIKLVNLSDSQCEKLFK